MGYIINFVKSFINVDSGVNPSNIPDIEALPNNQKNAVSPGDMQTLIKSSKEMPKFVESLRKTAVVQKPKGKNGSATPVRPKNEFSKKASTPHINERDGR